MMSNLDKQQRITAYLNLFLFFLFWIEVVRFSNMFYRLYQVILKSNLLLDGYRIMWVDLTRKYINRSFIFKNEIPNALKNGANEYMDFVLRCLLIIFSHISIISNPKKTTATEGKNGILQKHPLVFCLIQFYIFCSIPS